MADLPSSLDPLSAQCIEEQLTAIKQKTTIVLVTHSLRQARRMADHIIFIWMGEVIETGPAEEFFCNPQDDHSHA